MARSPPLFICVFHGWSMVLIDQPVEVVFYILFSIFELGIVFYIVNSLMRIRGFLVDMHYITLLFYMQLRQPSILSHYLR